MRALVVLMAVIAVGCDDGKAVCEPYETRLCHCAGAVEGAQECNAEGSGWTPCDCGATDTSTDEPADGLPDTTPADTPVETGCASAGDCDDSDPCTVDVCNGDGDCEHAPLDADGDGVIGTGCGGTDCDDSRDDVYPAAADVDCYDGVDQGCDGPDGPMLMIEDVLWAEQAGFPDHEMVWSGSEFGILARNGYDLRFERRDVQGATPAVGVPVSAAASGRHSLAWTGSTYAVAWIESLLVYLQVLDGTGAALSTLSMLGSVNSEVDIEVGWSGSEVAVLWSSPTIGLAPYQLSMMRADAEGAVTSTEINVHLLPAEHHVKDLVWTGSEYVAILMSHVEAGSPELWRIDASGSLLGSNVLPSYHADPDSGRRWNDTLAWTGSQLAYVYVLPATGDEIRLMRYLPDLETVGPSVEVSGVSDPVMFSPTVEWTGSELAVSWFNDRAPANDVYLARVAPDGSVIDTDIAIVEGVVLPGGATLTWNGSELGLAWEPGTFPLRTLLYNRIGFCN